VDELFNLWQERGLVTRPYFQAQLAAQGRGRTRIKFSNDANDLLRESAFCLIPAAPIANYLDTDPATHPSMTVDRMGQWRLIVEGANTYSPDPERKACRARMERAVYRQRGVLIATDYLVNSGGVIFAAQEQLIKTPNHLRIPEANLGDYLAVARWLEKHADELQTLAEKRRLAANAHREEVIRRNIRELVDLLAVDADLLPCEAAEHISIRRIAASERDRTAEEIMVSIPSILIDSTVQQAAAILIESRCPILAVVSSQGDLEGVVTEWDITRGTAQGSPDDQPLVEVMTREVIAADPMDGILDVIRKLEYHEISAMPVVDGKSVLGMVSSDLLARRSLLRLLQSQAG
jgi:glutamate dehydrogenase (NAD(P)+)